MKPNRIYCFGCYKLFGSQATFANHGRYDRECSAEKRFWGRVNKNTPNGCWIFMGCLDNWGYGDLGVGGKHIQSHRYAWKLLRGDPGEMDVLHKCNNPPCCNPDHMYLGTDLENCRDRLEAGVHYAKLNPDKVRAIREELSIYPLGKRLPSGVQKEMAERYGVTDKSIWAVRTGRKWSYIK